eukprot:Lankesteria_metandrocarpae@DN816_c0_g1_i1.p1
MWALVSFVLLVAQLSVQVKAGLRMSKMMPVYEIECYRDSDEGWVYLGVGYSSRVSQRYGRVADPRVECPRVSFDINNHYVDLQRVKSDGVWQLKLSYNQHSEVKLYRIRDNTKKLENSGPEVLQLIGRLAGATLYAARYDTETGVLMLGYQWDTTPLRENYIILRGKNPYV